VITYDEAVRIIDEHTKPLPSKRVPLSEAGGRFLASDVIGSYDSPPFDNSAVDGYGRREDDLGASRLKLAGTVAAGSNGDIEVPRGSAVRIFTGAPIPKGIAAISMQEDCEADGDMVHFHEASKPGDHIRRAGGDFMKGDTILRAGAFMNPAAVGIAASGRAREVDVTLCPDVSMLTTGTELMDMSHELTPGRIYDSNLHSLSSAVDLLLKDWTVSTASDTPEVLRKRLVSALQSDIAITCGGVSVGEHDLVREELTQLGVEQHFWRVAIKPGKPVYFGALGQKLVFGLPGNPVSALVTYFLFARPAILKMMGHPDPWPKPLKARFEGEARKNPGRMEFLRGNFFGDGSKAVVRGGQDSHMLSALASANCLIHFPLEQAELKTGDEVDVTMLNWGMA
jgi:molybdopterin molybdotransferase